MAKNLTSGQKKVTTLLKSTKLEEAHLLTLSSHKHIYDLYARTGELVGLHPHIKNEIVDAYKTEHPHYHYNPNCSACVCEMIVTIYNWYEKQINE